MVLYIDYTLIFKKYLFVTKQMKHPCYFRGMGGNQFIILKTGNKREDWRS